MKDEKLRVFGPKEPPVWAALCIGRADGSNADYVAYVRHPILVLVGSPESELEGKICDLLRSKGWREPEIKKLKLLNQPFQSEDPVMRACHGNAIDKEGGIIVYSDPIVDS